MVPSCALQCAGDPVRNRKARTYVVSSLDILSITTPEFLNDPANLSLAFFLAVFLLQCPVLYLVYNVSQSLGFAVIQVQHSRASPVSDLRKT